MNKRKPAVSTPPTHGGLTITRTLGEGVSIGDDITVEVLGLSATEVRLRIIAPKTTLILRRELQRRSRP